MPNRHLIGDALFDISFGSEKDAFEQSADLGSLMQHTILPVVDDVFTEFSATDEPWRIDRLEIDLGIVPYDGFQDALKQKLREQLDRILRERLPSLKASPIHGSDTAAMRRAECDALEYFLLHGHMPARMDLDPYRIFDQWLQRVLRHDRARLVTFLRRAGQRHTVVSRLVRQCHDATLWTIAQQLVSFNVHMLSQFIDRLRRIMTHAHWSQSAEAEIRHVIWEHLIIESLANQHMPLDKKALVSRIVTHASRRQGQTTLITLTHLASTATQYSTSAEPGLTLVSILDQLIAEEGKADISADTLRRTDDTIPSPEPRETTFIGPTTPGETTGIHDNTRLRRRVEAAFETGHPEELIAIWPELVRDHTGMLATLLRHYGVHARFRQQLARACPDTMLHDIVRVLEPHNHLMIHAIMDTLTRWQAYDIADRSTRTHRLWTGTLAYLLVECGPHFDASAYLRRLLWHLAVHEPQHYQALLRSLLTTTADALPGGLPTDLAGHLEALAADREPEDALAASAAQRAAIVHAYTLYGTVATTLRDDSMPPATTTDDLAGVIDTLARDHPWQLLRFYRELQTGTILSTTLTTRFSREALYRLLVALLALTQQTTGETPSDLQQAIDRYAEQASDQQRYYGQILDALIHNTVIDFEALMAEPPPTTPAHDDPRDRHIAAEKMEPPQVALAEAPAATPATSRIPLTPDEAETLAMTALTTTTPLSAEASTQCHQAITLLLTHHPTRLRALLDTALLRRTAATRLVEALPEPMLTALLALLRPAEYIPIQQAAESIMTASAAAHLLSPPDRGRRLTWLFIWQYLGEEGRAFDHRDFVTRLTAVLATQTPAHAAHDFRARLSQQLALDSLPSTLDHHRALLSTLGEITTYPLRTDTAPSDTSVTAQEPEFTDTPATTMEASEDSARLRRRVEAAFDAGHPEDLIAIWPELVRDHAGMLATLLRHYGVHARFRQQLARVCPDTILHDIVRVLEPRDYPMMAAIIDAVAQRPSPDMTSFADHDTLTHRLWTGTLAYLLVERGPHFDPPAYLRHLLWHLAAHDPEQYQARLRSLITTTAAALPGGLPSDLAVHLETLASEAGEEKHRSASTGQPAPLVQAYVLYDTLTAYLQDAGQPASTHVGDMAAIIDTLARDHPWQLLRFYRELQTGTLASSTLTTRFSREALYRLLVALLALTQQTAGETPSDLQQAIDRYAEHASDRQRYYGQILDALIQNTVIDFETLIAENRAAEAPTPLVASLTRLTPDEAEAIVGTALTTTTPLASEAMTRFQHAITTLLVHHPTRLRERLDTVMLHRTAATRLVEALSEPVLAELLALLLPAEYIPIQRAAESIMTAGAAAHLLSPPGRVRRLTWLFVWQYLIEEGHAFDHRDFVARLTASLTAHTPTRSIQDVRAQLSQQLALDSLPSTLDLHRTLLSTLGEIASHPPHTHPDAELIDAPLTAQETSFRYTPKTKKATDHTVTDKQKTSAQRAALVQAYVLYDRLIAYLQDGGQPTATHAEDMAAIIDTLAHDHPWQLLRFYRELQTGTLASSTLTTRFSRKALYRLLVALLALTQQEGDETSSELRQAIDRYAEQANDRQRYYGQILDALIHNAVIDFEALIAEPSPTMPPTRLTPEEAETIVATTLTAATPLTSETITRLRPAITTLLSHHPTRLRECLDEVLLHRTAATRLVEALPEPVLTALLALLRPAEALPIQRVAESIMTASAAAQLVPHPDRGRRLTWQFMWRYLLEEGRAFESRDFVTRLTASLAMQTPADSAHDFRARLSQQLALDSLPSTLDHHRALLSTLTDITDEERTSPLAQTSLPHSDRTDPLTRHEEDTTDEVYIVNAGQVLAAPYLPRLFAMLNLTDGSGFVSPEAAERAVHLLQFMVNECADSPEYQLVLNKILCGVRTGVPITREITVTDQERDAINGLVQGMIQNWKAIGNTSIAGFRESFLQRNGRLRLEDNAWHLVVEPRAFDMLIDQIPWSFSVIKHRWMHHPIHVQWR